MGAQRTSQDGRISGRGEFNRASPPKNVRKILDVIRFSILRDHVCVAFPGIFWGCIGRGAPLPMRKKFGFVGLE